MLAVHCSDNLAIPEGIPDCLDSDVRRFASALLDFTQELNLSPYLRRLFGDNLCQNLRERHECFSSVNDWPEAILHGAIFGNQTDVTLENKAKRKKQ
jgi:hypothetical protein